MAFRRKSKTKNDDWWSAPLQVPTDNGLDTGARWRAARRMRWFVTGCVLLCPVLALALILVVSQTLSKNHDPSSSAPQNRGIPSQVRAAALEEVDSWLTTDPSPLPGATVLGWDRAEIISSSNATALTWDVWSVYVLVSTDTAVYQVGVQVNYSQTEGAETVATPSLDLVPPSREGWSTGDWAGASPVTADDTTTRAVNAWAQAFVSGDADALTTVVADPDASHSYVPLSGVSKVSVSIIRAATRAASAEATPDASTLMVSVKLSITRPNAQRPADISYDLLVTGAGTGSARVVAWGPPGTGPVLKTGDNAVTGRVAPNRTDPGPQTPGQTATAATPTSATPVAPATEETP